MNGPSQSAGQRLKVREVAGVLRSRQTLDAVVDALLLAGFDRADIDLMASQKTVVEKLGGLYAPAEELADVQDTPRRAFIAREDIVVPLAGVAGILTYIGATAAALGVVASGGAMALTVAAAAAGGAAGGWHRRRDRPLSRAGAGRGARTADSLGRSCLVGPCPLARPGGEGAADPEGTWR